MEVTEIVEAENLNDSRTIANGIEKEKELNMTLEKAMASFRATLNSLFEMIKEDELVTKSTDKTPILRARLEEIMITFNEVNNKRKMIKKVRDAKDKAVNRKLEKLKESEVKIAEYKKKLEMEEAKNAIKVKKQEAVTQTEEMEMESEENGERQKKRKDRTPEDREQARRKVIKKVVVDTTTDDESSWERATGKKDRRKMNRKYAESLTSASDRLPEGSEKTGEVKTRKWSEVAKGSSKRPKGGEWRPRIKKSEAIEIKTTTEKSYEDMLREIKSKVKREE